MGALNVGTIPIRRDVVLFVVLLLVGLGSGYYFGKALAGEPHTAPTDYAILVAQVYQTDHDTAAAASRLKSAGFAQPAQAIATIAASYPTGTPEQARDAQSLLDLAAALGSPTTASSRGAGIPTAYILAALVGVVALGLVALLAFRILGLTPPSFSSSDALGRASQALKRRRAFATPGGSSPAVTWGSPDQPAEVTPGRPASAVDDPPIPDRRNGPDRQNGRQGQSAPPVTGTNSANGLNGAIVRTRPMQPSEVANGNGKPRPSGGGVPPIPLRPGQLRSSLAQRSYSFRSSYRLGDEPYDEIHPISDEAGRSLVGACGVSAGRFLNDHGQKRYWGFTAWLHDYASDGQFRAVGLVSRWASDHFADEIDDWRVEGDIDEVRLVDFDETIEIETTHLSAALVIEDVDYVQGVPPEAVFNRLAAQFDVEVRGATEPGSAASQTS